MNYEEVKALARKQAIDQGLFFIPQIATEEYLQNELRKLHDRIFSYDEEKDKEERQMSKKHYCPVCGIPVNICKERDLKIEKEAYTIHYVPNFPSEEEIIQIIDNHCSYEDGANDEAELVVGKESIAKAILKRIKEGK